MSVELMKRFKVNDLNKNEARQTTTLQPTVLGIPKAPQGHSLFEFS